MQTVMQTRIVKIGNSQGVRIPKWVLNQVDFGEEIELVFEKNQIVIRPLRSPRAGWDEQLKVMAENGDDYLLDGDHSLSNWDDEEWAWA